MITGNRWDVGDTGGWRGFEGVLDAHSIHVHRPQSGEGGAVGDSTSDL